MNGIYKIEDTDRSTFLGQHGYEFTVKFSGEGADKLQAGDVLEFLCDPDNRNFVIQGKGEPFYYGCIWYPTPTAYHSRDAVLGKHVRRKASLYNDTGYGPYKPFCSSEVAELLQNNYGGDESTLVETVKAIHEIYNR